mmetsp:Transcript_14801/g.30655  ORF Transcript_14801/g.30655 Transcript_14801/m.30655 type:complete len:264 (-) Transcript_14801:4-795(-)
MLVLRPPQRVPLSWVLAHGEIIPVPAQAEQSTRPFSQSMQERNSLPKAIIPVPRQNLHQVFPDPAHSVQKSVQASESTTQFSICQFISRIVLDFSTVRSIWRTYASWGSSSSSSSSSKARCASWLLAAVSFSLEPSFLVSSSSSSSSPNPGMALQSISHSSSSGQSDSSSKKMSGRARAATDREFLVSETREEIGSTTHEEPCRQLSIRIETTRIPGCLMDKIIVALVIKMPIEKITIRRSSKTEKETTRGGKLWFACNNDFE